MATKTWRVEHRGSMQASELLLSLGMRTLLRFLVVFVVVGLVSMVAVNAFGVAFDTADYWEAHGLGLLIGLTLFPRLTLLVSSIASGGLLWWVGWIFAPRMLVALLATVAYFHANPVLVVIAWLVALGGESNEKYWWHKKTLGRTKSVPPARVVRQ